MKITSYDNLSCDECDEFGKDMIQFENETFLCLDCLNRAIKLHCDGE